MANVGIYQGAPTSGARDGTLVTDAAPVVANLSAGTNTETSAMKLACRVIPLGYSRGSTTLSLVGTNAAKWALAPDSSGSPGTFGSYGASLTLGSLTENNTIFWAKAKVTSDETASATDITVDISAPDLVTLVELAPTIGTTTLDQASGSTMRVQNAGYTTNGSPATLKYVAKTTNVTPTSGEWSAASTMVSPQTITGLAPSTTYYVFVRSESTAGNTAAAVASLATTASGDDFNRANGSLGSGWTVNSGTWTITSNQLLVVTSGVADPGAVAVYNMTDMTTMAVSISMIDNVNSNDGGPIARYSASGFYHLLYSAGNTYIFRWSGGAFSAALAGPVATSISPGDVLKLVCNGTTISGAKNGSAIAGLTCTDAVLSSGKGGIRWGSGYASPGKGLDNFVISTS